MNAKDILVLGIKGSVVAYQRDTGIQLWSTHLKSNGFVSVVTDEKRVYAHTHGELFCLDLFTGGGVWNDPLKGLGYGVASLAGPGLVTATPTSVAEIRRQQQAASDTATHSST
jgi:outer membrane protein assembly factor BamB